MQALTNGFYAALAHLSPDCADFLTGSDETSSDSAVAQAGTVLMNTLYRFVELPQGPGSGAQTVGPNDVQINTAGAFFNAQAGANGTVTVGMPNSSGVSTAFTFASLSAFQGFILLHELGHQLDAYGADLNAAVNGANSAAILTHCFTQNAQGVYN